MARRGGTDKGLATQLKLALKRSGVTQVEAAQQMGVHVNTLNAWVNGRREIGGPDLVKFAEVTGTPVSRFTEGGDVQGEVFVQIADNLAAGDDAAQAIERAGGVLGPGERREYAGATVRFRQLLFEIAWEIMTPAEKQRLYDRVLDYAFRQSVGGEPR